MERGLEERPERRLALGAGGAQHAEHHPHLGERLASGRRHRPAGLSRAHRIRGGVRTFREGHDDGQRMRHDVVHLARDARTLGRGGELGLLVPLHEQLTRPVDEGTEVAAAIADVDTDERAEQQHHRRRHIDIDLRGGL